MKWNWQFEDWPKFTWEQDKLTPLEKSFSEGVGIIIGSSKHISEEGNQNLLIELMGTNALDSSEMEGEYLNRDSVQYFLKI